MNMSKNPIEIFNNLEKKEGTEIKNLWSHQIETLTKYFNTLKEIDNALSGWYKR